MRYRILAFGENAFAARFPSAAAAGISAWMIFLLVRRFAGDYTTALFASAAFLTCLEVFAIGVFSVLDSMFAMFVTLSMVVFFFAHCENRFQQKTGLLALFGLCCGLAFLTKGFIGFALPVAAIVPFLLWKRRIKELFGLSWIASSSLSWLYSPGASWFTSKRTISGITFSGPNTSNDLCPTRLNMASPSGFISLLSLPAPCPGRFCCQQPLPA